MTGAAEAEASALTSALEEKLEQALTRLEQARPFAKVNFAGRVLDVSGRMMAQPGGIARLYALAPRLDSSGIFAGTDWESPETLLPALVRNTFRYGQSRTVVLECLSELRMLAIALGDAAHPGLAAEQARHFLTQVLALNLDRVFGAAHEADRVRGAHAQHVRNLFQYLMEHIGFEDILGSLIDEIWRILAQRPVQVAHVKAMIRQIASSLAQSGSSLGDSRLGADRLVSALCCPTQGTRDEPDAGEYQRRCAAMDAAGLLQEARGFARAMHDTGIVSEHHVTFLRWLLSNDRPDVIADALGLSNTGLDAYRCYSDLVHRLIEEAIYPATAQAVYGLSMLLERGILYNPAVAPGLWRQINLRPSEHASALLASVFGDAQSPHVFLLAGVVTVLGLPLGVGQGNNPTCQAARALSMWSYSAPGYLLDLVARGARTDNVVFHFEGQPIASAELPLGLARTAPLDADAVSLVLVPHLDRIYVEMGRRCAGRGEDPHRWINPEFHGWWVGRDFFIAVDIATGALRDHEAFLRRFYASYHPYYNGNQPIMHPQPAGLAVTDSTGDFVGWHAITLIRVALDQERVMRVYFYNPNNDGGQDWGHGVVVSTQGHGELYGESSLPFPELASRLYIFHDDPVEEPDTSTVPPAELQVVMQMARSSWARERLHAVDQDTA